MFFSLQDVTVTLNGHTVEGEQTIRGWSEDSDALTLPDAFEFASVRRGATGDMAAFSTGDRGWPSNAQAIAQLPLGAVLHEPGDADSGGESRSDLGR